MHVIGRIEYIGLERGRDLMRAAVVEKRLGERANRREVTIMQAEGMIGVWRIDSALRCASRGV